jgi:predicted dienelactone hydrolase
MLRFALVFSMVAAVSCGTSGSGGGGNPVGSSGGSASDAGVVSLDDGGGGVTAPSEDGAVPVPPSDGCAPSVSPAPAEEPGCAGTTLLARPSDPSARGPWAVGAHTSTIAGLTTEIWYPAQWGSDSCQTPATYDVRQHLPPADQDKIPDSANPLQICDCYRDLPIDSTHGPYPVITFIHGTAAFRTQSLTFMTHWASRGFIVVSSDHPHIQLADVLTLNILGANEEGEAVNVLSALATPTGDLSFLAGHMDMTRMAASGHSAGGGAVETIASETPGIQVVIPMAAGGVDAPDGGAPLSSLVMSAADDGIATPSSQVSGYASTAAPKRFVQIANAGHLVFSDLCAIGASEGGLLAIAEKYGVSGASVLAPLASDGCAWQTGKSYTPITPQEGWAVVDFATSAVLEETLMCDTSMTAAVAGIQTSEPNVGTYEQQLQ